LSGRNLKTGPPNTKQGRLGNKWHKSNEPPLRSRSQTEIKNTKTSITDIRALVRNEYLCSTGWPEMVWLHSTDNRNINTRRGYNGGTNQNVRFMLINYISLIYHNSVTTQNLWFFGRKV